MATVRLLGPDLATPLVVPVDISDTVGRLKEIAVENWPSGAMWPDPASPAVVISPLVFRSVPEKI